MYRVFIDGQAGTTGLEIAARLGGRCDMELLHAADDHRKDPAHRRELLNEADVVILCLPDDAARDAVALIDNPRTRILDASTAHRVADGWVYGLPELLPGQRRHIAAATRVSNPGCYPTGFLLAVRPLVDARIIDSETTLSAFAVSGYSGGGRSMIERYERNDDQSLIAPRAYGLAMDHKHVPEMRIFAGLANPPLFSPMVGGYYKGMAVYVPLTANVLARGCRADEIQAILAERFADEACVHVAPVGAADQLEAGFLAPEAANDTNRVDLMVFGDARQTLVAARLDNLGKGASGAAVQNLNLMLGVPELTGLVVTEG